VGRGAAENTGGVRATYPAVDKLHVHTSASHLDDVRPNVTHHNVNLLLQEADGHHVDALDTKCVLMGGVRMGYALGT